MSLALETGPTQVKPSRDGLPLVESSLKGAISRQGRKEGMRTGGSAEGRRQWAQKEEGPFT